MFVLCALVLSVVSRSVESSFFFSGRESSSSPASSGEILPLTRTTGLPPSAFEKYQREVFECDGNKVLNSSSVNDDFCDCEDGSDEPGTSACAVGRFYCLNKGYKPSYITSSRVEDGVCDCCDGSDERSREKAQCTDYCHILAEKEKEKLSHLLNAYKVGSKKRQELIDSVKSSLEDESNSVGSLSKEEKEHEEKLKVLEGLETEADEEFNQNFKITEEEMFVRLSKMIGLSQVNDIHLSDLLVHFLQTVRLNDYEIKQILKKNYDHLIKSLSQSSHFQNEVKVEVEVEHNDQNDQNEQVLVEEEMDGYGEVEEVHEIHQEKEHEENKEEEKKCVFLGNPDHLSAPAMPALCDYFPPAFHNASFSSTDASLVPSILRQLILEIVYSKEIYGETQWLLGYLLMNDKLDGATEFVTSQKDSIDSSTGELRGEECAISISPNSEGITQIEACSIAARARNEIVSVKEIKKQFVNPHQSAIAEVRGTLQELRRKLRSAEGAKNKLELHKDHLEFLALNNECFDMRDSHYTYTVCVMKNVVQKDDDSSSRVTLGDFDEVVEQEDGSRNLIFSNGQHCHAFGARSASVIVRCGEANKVLTAREPTTCAYLFEMESPAACTQKFAEVNGLLNHL